jgi:pilus assembly protein Flp/PilA
VHMRAFRVISPVGMRRTGWEHMTILIRFLKDKSAATAIEYGLLASLISIGMIIGLGLFSDSLLAVFQKVTNAIIGAGAV